MGWVLVAQDNVTASLGLLTYPSLPKASTASAPETTGSPSVADFYQFFLDARRDGLIVFAEAFDIPFYCFANVLQRLCPCATLRNTARKRRAGRHEPTVFILLNMHSILHIAALSYQECRLGL